VVIGPDGLTDFKALRRRVRVTLAVLYAFDLIELDGCDLRGMPIETRKATLASLLRKPGAIRLSEHIAADGPQVFAQACRLERGEIRARNPRARAPESSRSLTGKWEIPSQHRNTKGHHYARSVVTFDDNGRRCRRW
jgi:bifunctional non-homologous end joining protein LigD